MKLRLLFLSLFCSLLLANGVVRAQSVGIIGDATPTLWDSDTDMVLDSADSWSITINLKAGGAKFRLDDKWDINWGAGDFPAGIGTQGGANIPIPAAGEFKVTFNSATGAYKFVVQSDIGIIGDATPGGWNDDTNMFRDTIANKYFLTLPLTKAKAKFRQDDKWDVNWGSIDFPTGVGTQGGSDIPIAAAGKYLVTFDKSTGAYDFKEVIEFNTIGLIGTATPGQWASDTNLTRDAGNPDIWKGKFNLTVGLAKFRANDAWTISWGDTTWPAGIATLGGPDIPVKEAGDYQVTFNTKTGEYKFLIIGNYGSIGIIGTSTPDGWASDVNMDNDPIDKSIWKKRIILKTGLAKFRADDQWTNNWGGATFPTGTATLDGADIPVDTGEYIVHFNSTTLEYNFEKLKFYSTVGIVGTGTPLSSWDIDVDMTKDVADESFWYINSITLQADPVTLGDGKVKFRAEDAWTVNWGGTNFLSGVGTQDGSDLIVVPGTYKATLNSATGEYAFVDPVSTFDVLRSDVIKLFPNPANDVVNIQISEKSLQGDVKITIFNSLGAAVSVQNLNVQESATPIKIAGLVSGNYLVQISNSKYTVGKSLVIVK